MPLSLIDTRTSRILFTAILFALGLGLVYAARRTLIWFLFAIFFAYLMAPAVSRLERVLHSRGRAIASIYLLMGALLVVFFMYLGPQVGRQAARMGGALPNLLESVGSGEIAEQIGTEHGLSGQTQQQLKIFLATHRDSIMGFAQRGGIRAAEFAQQAPVLFLIPILAIFFLRDGKTFGGVLLSLVHTRPQRELLEGVLHDLNKMLAHFIRAQLTLAALSGFAYSSFLGLMRVPNALMLGTLGGMLEFVPVVGPIVAAVMILGAAVLMSYRYWIWILVFLVLWRLVQDYLVSPRIMGKSMELHPLAAIFGVLAGGEIAGVLGVYLSIPVMASLRIVWRRWRLYAEKRKFGPLNEYSFAPDIPTRK